MGTPEKPICLACGDEIANLASKCKVRGVPGHFHAGCTLAAPIIRNMYRAGLRECAELADQWSEARLDEANAPIISGDVFTDGGVFVQSAADANAGYRLMDFAKSIRARIAALETEEGK